MSEMKSVTSTFWCEHAWLNDGIADSVRIVVTDGRFESITAGAPRQPDDHVLEGLTLAGAANGHSHAFHRALRGAGAPGGTFWEWRKTMYRIAQALTPDSYYRLARGVYGEMVAAGYTSVAEFHYVHHQADGTPYDDPNEMGHALRHAAADAGIRLTLLDTCYLSAGFGEPLAPEQLRFSDGDADSWADRVTQLAPTPDFRVGAAIHSVRAVDEASMRRVAEWAQEHQAPLHVHLSEQTAENDQCLDHTGLTPTALLDRAGVWNARATGVHAVFVTMQDIHTLGERGASVCVCPSTECDLADGIAPASSLAAAGVRLGVGSDQNVLADPFTEAREVEMHERLRLGTRENFTPAAQIAMLTADGQRLCGWPEAGRLEVGSLADFVTLDTRNSVTAGSRLDRVVQMSTAAQVVEVYVGGRQVAHDGHCNGVDQVQELAETCAQLRGER
ncbi:formimidoylglutamate deiminase [Pseudoclavibacter sp. CFCC 11306]|uniref:formimidoylglutamate deiminase n=1 Tax=Pseudoclavibacter sp. CFCC 11306 TaxID=1564493 RepID=UPI0017879DF4|nr:formimidoylglutamate deiminase [Pseudoclavibacter sp. CFCC 11306]